MKKENITIEDLIKGIQGISDAISREQGEEHLEDVLKTIDKYEGTNLLDVDSYNVYIRYQQDDFNEVLLKVLLGKEQLEKGVEYDRNQINWLVTFYKNSYVIDRLLEETIVEYEGSPMSADKSRTILRDYGKHLRGEEVSEWDSSNYWIPDSGTQERWFAYVYGILRLQIGDSKEYIKQKQELEELLKQVKDDKEQYIKEECINQEYYEKEITWEYEKRPVYKFKQELEDRVLYAEICVTERGTMYRLYKENSLRETTKVEKEDAPEWVRDLLEKLQK